MSQFRIQAALLAATTLACAHPALAGTASPASAFGAPIALGDGFSVDPIIDGRLRWEEVDQPTKSADAITMRLRAGFELANAPSHLSLLAEAGGTVALDDSYNAFPFALPGSYQYRSTRSVVADPQSIALNRLQLAYRVKDFSVTVGRQRINLDDERWVGSVGWRQNEQTFDAVRTTAQLGMLSLDGTYAESQRMVFGNDAGAHEALDGRFWFLGAALKTGPITTKGFAYLLDYNDTAFTQQTNSSQTYGLRVTGATQPKAPLGASFVFSFAQQSSYASNPVRYTANYLYAEGAVRYKGLSVKTGYEVLGADPDALNGITPTTFAVQTPMATFHKWDGWADQFLTTPAKGLQRSFVSASYAFPASVPIPGLNAQVTYHDFHSDIGSLEYGHEWDGAIGWKTGPVKWLAKYADYTARAAGTDTRKIWLQAEFAF